MTKWTSLISNVVGHVGQKGTINHAEKYDKMQQDRNDVVCIFMILWILQFQSVGDQIVYFWLQSIWLQNSSVSIFRAYLNAKRKKKEIYISYLQSKFYI